MNQPTGNSVESRMRRNPHVRFGERPGETDRGQPRHRAPGRLDCRMPARRCQDDHTIAHQHGGPTEDRNLGKLCVTHHVRKTKGKIRMRQIAPGVFAWITALGHTHLTGPEPPYD